MQRRLRDAFRDAFEALSTVSPSATPAPPPAMTGFVICPLALIGDLSLLQLAWQRALYEQAFEQARLMARPSIFDHDLAPSWN